MKITPSSGQLCRLREQLQSLLDMQSGLLASASVLPADRKTKYVEARSFAQRLVDYGKLSSVAAEMSRDEVGTACLLAVAKRYVDSVSEGKLQISTCDDS